MRIISLLKAKGYRVYKRPYELNIIGVRSAQTHAGKFDDQILVIYRDEKKRWRQHVFAATTDPGTYWLENPMNPQGTAILKEGQYVDAYRMGLHKGKYVALVQRKPVTVLRDYDRNSTLDFLNGVPDTGLFGINIHRALRKGTALVVDRFSAGCQVFKQAEDFYFFIDLCYRHRALYGNNFTYTLLDFRALRKQVVRRVLLGSTMVGTGLLAYYALTLENE